MPCLRLLRRTRLCREAEPLEKPWRGRPSGTDLVLPVPAESSLRFVHSDSETVRMVSSNSSRYLATWQVAVNSAERSSTPHIVGMLPCTSIALGGNISRFYRVTASTRFRSSNLLAFVIDLTKKRPRPAEGIYYISVRIRQLDAT